MQAAQECLWRALSLQQLERSAAEEVEAALHALIEETEMEEPVGVLRGREGKLEQQ
jgi:hypothetical protein